MNLTGIKNIILDLGEVIINLSQERTIHAFKNLFNDQFEVMQTELQNQNILTRYEIGEITSQEFLNFFKGFNQQLTDEAICDAWNSMLLDIPKERIELIAVLAKKYRLFLLSNTNEIHLAFINNYVNTQFGLSSISAPFERSHFSHLMKMRKPNAVIFNEVLTQNNLIAQETLFIDDTEEHIITAKQLNLKTHHLLATETITDLFHEN